MIIGSPILFERRQILVVGLVTAVLGQRVGVDVAEAIGIVLGIELKHLVGHGDSLGGALQQLTIGVDVVQGCGDILAQLSCCLVEGTFFALHPSLGGSMAATGGTVVDERHAERDGPEGVEPLVADGTANDVVDLLHTHIDIERHIDTLLLLGLLLLMARLGQRGYLVLIGGIVGQGQVDGLGSR